MASNEAGPAPRTRPAGRKRNSRSFKTAEKKVRLRPLKPALNKQRPFSVKTVLRYRTENVVKVPQRSCGISLCRRPNCNLRTHRHDGVHHLQSNNCSPTNGPKSRTYIEANVSTAGTDHQYADLSLLRGGVDGLPSLPLDEQHRDVYIELFHHFFAFQYDQITRIMKPPPITVLQKQLYADEKNRVFVRAVSAPIFCLHVCASSHHQLIFRKDGQQTDNITALIRFNLTALLRDLLGNIESEVSIVNDVLLVILTLVMFETSMHDYSALPFHRQAMSYIVRKQGGVHNMTQWIPFVCLLDRLIAIFTALPPTLCEFPNRAIRRPPRHPYTYGTHFESRGQNLDDEEQSVYDFCFDTCRAIEVMEHEGPPYDPAIKPQSGHSDLHYLYFLKENLAAQFAHLNARFAQNQTITKTQLMRCTILATKIVDFATLHNNYTVSIPIYCADTIQIIFEECSNVQLSTEDSNMCSWMLFVLVSMQIRWDGRSWALWTLQNRLEEKYGSADTTIWAEEWKKDEHDNVRAFVWSDTCFHSGFVKACNELEIPLSMPPEADAAFEKTLYTSTLPILLGSDSHNSIADIN